MARRVTKKEKTEAAIAAAAGSAPKAQAPTQHKSDPIYPVEVFLENSKAMFGRQPYVLHGALHGVEVPAAGITKSHMQALIDRFLSQPLS